jgi:hypothetical protein
MSLGMVRSGASEATAILTTSAAMRVVTRSARADSKYLHSLVIDVWPWISLPDNKIIQQTARAGSIPYYAVILGKLSWIQTCPDAYFQAYILCLNEF